MLSTRVKTIPLLSFDTSTLTTSYQALGTLANACFLLRFTNVSANLITISFDGINDADIVGLANLSAPYSTPSFSVAAQTNSQPQSQEALWAVGTVIYVKSVSSEAGKIYVAGYYV